MKTKGICAATLLALSLSIPAVADGGDQHTPGSPVPCNLGTSCTIPGNPGLASSATDSSPNTADILWALASIFLS
jgi:hypothetical protein